ncbi:hypothetical protein O6H91_18G067300 [Diphasiastrum complanatum]|uniref:Uncharacterized protein n=1 Tax=Diphasiastrum complanatum TaxID=34168 RepID=A0ACC2B294_DIPCM|nr:hypothetical protein O6H91_18G067300 [Diphasiastrum complanatum]
MFLVSTGPRCLTCNLPAAPRCLTCWPCNLPATSALCVLAGGRLLPVCDPCTSLFRLVSDIPRPVPIDCDIRRAVYNQNSSQKSVCDQNSENCKLLVSTLVTSQISEGNANDKANGSLKNEGKATSDQKRHS